MQSLALQLINLGSENELMQKLVAAGEAVPCQRIVDTILEVVS